MIGRRTLGLALAAVIAALAFGMETDHVEAAPDVVTIGSATMSVGEARPVEVVATDIADPGVGAWTIDVSYDDSVVELIDCVGLMNSVCNTSVAPRAVRVTGASPIGLPPEATLGVLGFRCIAGGSSALTITIDVWAYATVTIPLPRDVELRAGTVACVPAKEPIAQPVTPTALPSLPVTGTAPTSDWGVPQWAIALLTAAGASLVALAALRRDRA